VGTPGTKITISVQSFGPGELLDIQVVSQNGSRVSIAQVEADRKGSFTTGYIATGESGDELQVQVHSVNQPDRKASSPDFHIIGFSTADSPKTLIVERGETLNQLAQRFDRTTYDLLTANPHVENINRVYPGLELTIPGRGNTFYTEPNSWPERVDQARENGLRWVEVNLSHQSVHAWEGDRLIRSFLASTGKSRTPTITGEYEIWIRLKWDDMRGPGYFLKSVPFVMYFHEGYGLHGTYWHNKFGTPMSAGCVNMSTTDAEWLFYFTTVGTLVHIH
jgi:lipoprotein-anchoring transpeptidase ErfK/SrfK